MSKSKKAKKTDGHESPAQVESQEINEEQTPATIVEAGMEEVFQAQAEGTEAVTEEKPEPKPPRVSKRPYISDVEILLNAGSHTKQEMLALILEKYPAVSKGGASTFLTDLCNIKYNHFHPRTVVKLADGKLQFADMVPATTETPEPETQLTDEPPDAPAE